MSGHNSNSSVFKVAVNLAIACMLSGLIIAIVYAITNPTAEMQRVRLKEQAMRNLVPTADKFEEIKGKDGWYAAVKGGAVIAYEVPAESKGYGGAIKMIVAVDVQGKSLGYSILSMNETPGLGDNAIKPKFEQQFVGKSLDNLEDSSGNPQVVKVPTKEHIQALTGATITSRAVTRGVADAVKQVDEYVKNGK